MNHRTAVPSSFQVACGFAAVYVIWGSTYLAIRYAVTTIPPLTMAGLRFVIAGALLYPVIRWRGAPRPRAVHWRSAAIVGGLLLLGGNGIVCWAEQWVDSGMTALLVATVSLWMVVVNWVRPGGVAPTPAEAVGVVIGFIGVVVLIDPRGASLGDVNVWASSSLLLASLFWAGGSIYSRHCDLPRSALLATAMEMLAGGAILLTAAALTGEWARFEVARISSESLLASLYLIVFGSLIGFSAYIWILQVSTPALVSTYAYVNPVIAVLLGWLIAGEHLTRQNLVAMVIIVGSVVVITTSRQRGARRAVKLSDVPACEIGAGKPATSADDA